MNFPLSHTLRCTRTAVFRTVSYSFWSTDPLFLRWKSDV